MWRRDPLMRHKNAWRRKWGWAAWKNTVHGFLGTNIFPSKACLKMMLLFEKGGIYYFPKQAGMPFSGQHFGVMKSFQGYCSRVVGSCSCIPFINMTWGPGFKKKVCSLLVELLESWSWCLAWLDHNGLKWKNHKNTGILSFNWFYMTCICYNSPP